MTKQNFKKTIVSGTVASALILSIATPAAFANEKGTEQDTVVAEEMVVEEIPVNYGASEEEIVEENIGQEVAGEEATEDVESNENKENTEKESTEEEVQAEETSPLVPGDFFYFVKQMIEKVRLAVTVDDYKEAKLLADFAAERIAEANALLVKGKTEEAEELLQKAIETQEAATDTLPEAEEVSDEETEAIEKDSVEEEKTEEDLVV